VSGEAAQADTRVPRLPRGVRLRYDEVRSEWALLAPERILKPNLPAIEILKRCDGKTTLDAIVDDLATTFRAPRKDVAKDVSGFLAGLAAKGMLDL
jgi:pyrroloquinoline quinone biosynthesis protein D